MVVTEAMKKQQRSVSTLIFTGRIYDHKKIREQFPEALLVCVMRNPWRYTPRDILRLRDLGPPEQLLKYCKEHEGAKGQALINLQAYYTAEYFRHLYDGLAGADLGQLQLLMNDYDKVILLCHEKRGEFCHRHLLRYHLVDDWDVLNAGEIGV